MGGGGWTKVIFMSHPTFELRLSWGCDNTPSRGLDTQWGAYTQEGGGELPHAGKTDLLTKSVILETY